MTRGKQASRAGILFSDVKPKRLEWDWYPFIPRGKVVIVDGEPEEGKSAFILDLMARITTGRSMPFAAELRGWWRSRHGSRAAWSSSLPRMISTTP